MMLDDVYGSDFDRFPLEQESATWDTPPELEWDEADERGIAEALIGRPIGKLTPD
jgi:hypothetical protein